MPKFLACLIAALSLALLAPVEAQEELRPGRRRAVADFDGDGRTDLSVFRPQNAFWYWRSGGGATGRLWGLPGDRPVPADYDGDGRTDLAVFRPGDNLWYIEESHTGSLRAGSFGRAEDTLVPQDYDGDGKADLAVFHRDAQTGLATWWVQRSRDGVVTVEWFGLATDEPVPGFYDSDRKADLAVYRPTADGRSQWWVLSSATGAWFAVTLEMQGQPVPGDYDGDGLYDFAVFGYDEARVLCQAPDNGTWYVVQSSNIQTHPEGESECLPSGLPVPGDYDGDGTTDRVVYSTVNFRWAGAGLDFGAFGQSDDRPVPYLALPVADAAGSPSPETTKPPQ